MEIWTKNRRRKSGPACSFNDEGGNGLTYIQAAEGWSYSTGIKDLHSRDYRSGAEAHAPFWFPRATPGNAVKMRQRRETERWCVPPSVTTWSAGTSKMFIF